MIGEIDNVLLLNCRILIEEKLQWNDSHQWSTQDFDMLSEQIAAQTGITLSTTTLKRIWGRVKYDSSPTITTLNTLAQFVGYENWRSFQQNESKKYNQIQFERTHVLQTLPVQNAPVRRLSWAWPTVVLLLAATGYLWRTHSDKAINPIDYQFSSKKVLTIGVPNSVIFTYNAIAASSDSVFIQQSWNPDRRTRVSREQQQHTSIYYWPGYFVAKLIIGNQIVKEHNVFIQSQGWLPMVMQLPVPVYFKPADVLEPTEMRLSLEKIQSRQVSFQPQIPWVHYYNVRAFDDITTDQFRFETEVKNEYSEGAAACQLTQILLLTEGSAIIIPLSIKGCVSELSVLCIDQGISGKTKDLSGFGVDFSDWVKVACESKNQRIKFFVGGNLAYEHVVKEKATKIVGIVYRFQGTGAVRNVTLKEGERIVYQAFQAVD